MDTPTTTSTSTPKPKKPKIKSTNTVYIGHIPKSFEEKEMNSYFSQFGKITRLRISRNPRTGKMRHFGYIEFAEPGVAEIVAETHNGYILFEHILECHVLLPEQIHPDLWKNHAGPMKQIPWRRIHRKKFNQIKTEKSIQRSVKRNKKKQEKMEKKLADLGIKYTPPA